MTVNSDSIQTLLKQRRQLRDCLKELKTEISQLNDKASRMPEDHADATAEQILVPQIVSTGDGGFDVPIMSDSELDIPKKTKSTPELMADMKPDSDQAFTEDLHGTAARSLSQKVLKTPPPDPEPMHLKLEVKPKESAVKLTEVEAEIKPEPTSPEAIEVDIEQTLQNAILLAGFFLHHPSAAGNQLLNTLDDAIQQAKTLPHGTSKTQALNALKDAYRNVLARTYPENHVTGQSISHSQKGNPYLFGIPMMIAALVLVVMPLLMLFQIVTDRQFASEIADELELLLNGMYSFVWGAVGALSFMAINVTRLVRRRSYLPSRIAGVGLITAAGGIVGILIFIVFSRQDLMTGTLLDYVQSLAAFGAGLLCGGCLQKLLSRKVSAE